MRTQITINTLVGTSEGALFTFSGPSITAVTPSNLPTSGGSSLSLQGQLLFQLPRNALSALVQTGTNFAISDFTPTVFFSPSQSITASWTSYTLIRASTQGTGSSLQVKEHGHAPCCIISFDSYDASCYDL
jgi:hypothetical protein